MIAVDIAVIWALAAHGRQLKQLRQADAEYQLRR
jgi:hypothetical protein